MNTAKEDEVMMAKNTCINVEDLTRLSELLETTRARHEEGRAHLKTLGETLHRAVIALPNRMPPDVVTMYSRVRLTDLDFGEELERALLFPDDAETVDGGISVVAPLGAALLGRRVGDLIQVHTPAGTRRLRIDRLLHQPEAAAAASRGSGVEGGSGREPPSVDEEFTDSGRLSVRRHAPRRPPPTPPRVRARLSFP